VASAIQLNRFWVERGGKGGGKVKKLVLLLLLTLAVACGGGEGLYPLKDSVPAAETTDGTFVIEVLGTTGLMYQGTIGGINKAGQYVSRSVDGMVSSTYHFEGSSVSCVFQKMERSGTLTVWISRGGFVIASQSTTAEYGAVSLAID